MKRVLFHCSVPLALLCVVGAGGCTPTGRTTTVTTTREYDYEPRASYARYNRRSPYYRDEPTIAERITEPVTDDDGGLFNIVGDVITLPFKLVGAVFDVLL